MLQYFSFALSVGAAIFSVLAYLKTRSFDKYKSGDELVAQILRVNLSYPEFNELTFTSQYTHQLALTDDRYRRYDIYAMMVWNCLESLLDYYGKRRLDASPFGGVVYYWTGLHASWYRAPNNRGSYDDLFEVYIAESEPDLRRQLENATCLAGP